MRRSRLDLAHDAHDFFQFAHQLGAVLQAAGGVDQHDVAAVGLGGGDGFEREARRIGARRARHHRGAGALAPDFQLLYCRGAEGVAGDQHHRLAVGAESGGELADGRGLAGTVDAGDENDERPGRHVQRLGDRRQHLFDFGGEQSPHLLGRDALFEAAVAQGRRDPLGELHAEIGADQFAFQIVQGRGVKLALGHQIGDGAAE